MSENTSPLKILLFLIYGTGREYHLELTYSILSAARFLKDDPAGVRIVLASDASNQRPDLPVEHLLIDDETLKEWQMGGTYFHAAKPHALSYALHHFDAPTILIDSDTIIHTHPKHLFDRVGPGRSLMHRSEGPLDQMPNWQEWKTLIDRSGGTVAGRTISNASVMQNSGALGLDPEDVHLMDDIIAVIRAIRVHSDVFTAEQLAASLVLHQPTEIMACEDSVEHYWDGPRPYYRYQMARMFPQVLSGGSVDEADWSVAPLRQEPPVKIIDRIAARLKRLHRRADWDYAYAYLAYRSALSCRHQDPDLANVWADKALAILSWGLRRQRPEAAQDFSAFAPAKLHALGWMEPDLQSRWHKYWAQLPC